MKRHLSCVLVTLVLSSLFGCSSTGGKDTMLSSLASEPGVSTLMKAAGVTSDQAIGGLGSILSLAKGKVSPEDFSKLTSGIPSADKYMSALGGLGIKGGDIKSVIDLENAYNKLGMSEEAVSKFTPAAINYVRSTGGEAAAGVLSGLGL